MQQLEEVPASLRAVPTMSPDPEEEDEIHTVGLVEVGGGGLGAATGGGGGAANVSSSPQAGVAGFAATTGGLGAEGTGGTCPGGKG